MVPSLDPLLQSSPPLSQPSPQSWRHIAEQEAERLGKQNPEAMACCADNDKDDTTPWFARNRWHQLFEGKDLKVGPLL